MPVARKVSGAECMAPALYIHIPFCRNKCLYCDFYSLGYDKNIACAYIDVLARQILELKQACFSTIYIGGGTPTVLSMPLLRKLFKSLRACARGAEEWTVEANPESLDEARLSLFNDEGVNRISIGAQSFNDLKLKKLGRVHSSLQAREAVLLARRKGFRNVGIDLIFGVWGESLKDWARDLEQASALPLEHISAYSLTCEKGTVLAKKSRRGGIVLLAESIAGRMYKSAIQFLKERGFWQYEISNFARTGHHCRHNMRYWDNQAYIGLGPSAVSYQNGSRSKNISSVNEYIQRARNNIPCAAGSERLPDLKRAKESAALKIRTIAGIDFADFAKRHGVNFLDLEGQALTGLIKKGLIKYKMNNGKRSGVLLTKKGVIFADTVCSGFL